ncbi:MAG: sulfotransferase [Nitrospirae bacterium]|nr:sulfotransferase [Nitrospirota bacterium]
MIKNSLFILGCERSGTTMLAGLLKNTPYGEPIETHFITKYYRKLNDYGNLENKDNFTRLLKDFLSERPVMQWKLNIGIDDFYREFDDFSYQNIINKICIKQAEKKGYKLWGDKTPHYILDIDVLYKLFPTAKYIYIVRDGRDVALSLLNVEWEPYNILTCAERWKRYNRQNDVLDKLKSSNQLYSLRYEDLLDNAERIVPDVYKFLDEEYNENKMNELIGRIRKGNYGKWKSKMNTRQIKLFESIAANTLKRFGYETTYEESEISGLTKAVYNSHELLMRTKFLFKINIVDGIKIKFFGKEPFAD